MLPGFFMFLSSNRESGGCAFALLVWNFRGEEFFASVLRVEDKAYAVKIEAEVALELVKQGRDGAAVLLSLIHI